MSDKQARKYFENMPYGNDAKSSEIHGKANQVVVNDIVEGLVRKYDEAMTVGDKSLAGKYDGAIKQISRDLDNLKEIKKEFSVNYGGGTGGKNMFSNYTNLKQFDIPFWLEGGKITFDENLKPILSVPDSLNPNKEISKRIEDITENWVIKGSEESNYMQMHQDAVKQRNTLGEPLDFDVDWQVDNLLHNNDAWKIFVSDKVGGRYFLQDYVMENQKEIESGNIPDDMLHPDSFNPNNDTRLHKYYSSRIKRAFDPNYLMPEEVIRAKQLESRVVNLDETKSETTNNPKEEVDQQIDDVMSKGKKA
tara:strand:+ start:494 stop:1411 length:918 start_codon:yes stop_codon:yes gene_type:complete